MGATTPVQNRTYGVQLSLRQQNSKHELNATITATFINLNKKTVGKAYRKFRNPLKAVVKPNGDFFG